MNNFDKIIKQKAEQFEVSYNEAHWAEMNSKLNAIRATKIKTTIFSLAAVISILAISSYFVFSKKQTLEANSTLVTNDTTIKIIEEKATFSEKENTTAINNKLDQNNISNQNNVVNNVNLKKEEIIKPNFSEKKDLAQELQENNPEKETKENITNLVNAEFIVYNNKVCLGDEVVFEPVKENSLVSYLWDFGDGTTSQKVNPTHIYKRSQKFTVTLTLQNRQTGNETKTVQENVITIFPTPQASFSYTETSIAYDDNKLKYPYTIFKINSLNKQNTYSWNFGNEETSNSINSKTIFKKKEHKYKTTLIVENSFGCVNSSTLEVLNKNGVDLYAPNAIRTNSKYAKNTTFMPAALKGWEVQFEMKIIDKSGNLIYETSDKDAPWNGKKNNTGQLMAEDIYLWHVITFDVEGNPLHHHGAISLVR